MPLLVIDAVLVVDVQQFVFDPADLLGRLFTSLVMQTILFIQLSQTHHGLLTHTPLQRSTRKKPQMKIFTINLKKYVYLLLINKNDNNKKTAQYCLYVLPSCLRSFHAQNPGAGH